MVESQIIYFDNAATSYPKPESVYRAHDSYLRRAGNPGRGAHRLALDSARAVFVSRTTIASFLGIKNSERLIFTPGCTYSINAVLRGFSYAKQHGWKRWLEPYPPVVIVSALEHNAVMRPLHILEKQGELKIHKLKYASSGVVDPQELQQAIHDYKPVLCAIQAGSNVTGELIDTPLIWQTCRASGVSLLVDAAQTARLGPIDLSDLASSDTKYGDAGLFWCASGHKGLMGPPGVGLLYVDPSVEIEPYIAGGTGSNSENLEMPQSYPDRLEPGTQPGPSIAALAEGVAWLNQEGLTKIRAHEMALTKKFLDWCAKQSFIKVFGNRFEKDQESEKEKQLNAGLPIVSFAMESVTPDRIADQLDSKFGIAVRPGLHCAMSAHQSLGTLKTGLTRASFGYFNTYDEIDALCRALAAINASTISASRL